MKKEEGVSIFGRFFSNRELFWNGVAFLLIGIAYDVLAIGSHLPQDWRSSIESIPDIDNGWVIQTLLFIMSYLLLDRRFFGNNLEKIIEKHGLVKYSLLKLLLVFTLLFANFMLKILGLIIFF